MTAISHSRGRFIWRSLREVKPPPKSKATLLPSQESQSGTREPPFVQVECLQDENIFPNRGCLARWGFFLRLDDRALPWPFLPVRRDLASQVSPLSSGEQHAGVYAPAFSPRYRAPMGVGCLAWWGSAASAEVLSTPLRGNCLRDRALGGTGAWEGAEKASLQTGGRICCRHLSPGLLPALLLSPLP